jgi:Mn2+/Fe2+ NRAMP family transporter
VAGRFHLPYINAKWIAPALFIVGMIFFWNTFTGLFIGENIVHNFPYFLFVILSLSLTVLAFVKNLSLIPVLGLLSCFYLMAELDYESWLRFLIWLVVGLVIYFTYSYKHSLIGKEEAHLAK